MATRKPKKKAAPKKASAKKAPAKKAAKKAAKKKAAKKTAAKGKAASKKKAAAKKAPAKKAAPKKAAKKKAKAAPKKSAAKKKTKKAAARNEAKTMEGADEEAPSSKRAKRAPAKPQAPRPEREARRAKPDLPNRDADEDEGEATDDIDVDIVDENDVLAIEDDGDDEDVENGEAMHRRKRPRTSLPPDHEILDPGPLRGEPVDKGTVIEAIRAAFKADEEHPVRGREFLGARSPADVPQEGEVDYARAVEAQKAAAEVLERADMVGEERKAVDDRIAEVYSGEMREYSGRDRDWSDE